MIVTVKNKQSLMDVTVENYGQIDNLVEVSNDNGKSISESLETNENLTVNSENKGDQEIKDKITTQGLSFNNDSSFELFDSIQIGIQTWALKNWDFNWIGSRVYDDDENNRILYGGLYTWEMVTDPDFAPDGWRVANSDDWNTMISYLGGGSIACVKLKESGIEFWDNDNGSNESGFSARGGGRYSGSYVNLNILGWFWSSTEISPSEGRAIALNDNNDLVLHNILKTNFYSVRLIKI